MAPYPRSATAQLLIVVVGMYGRTLLVSSTGQRNWISENELLKANRCPVVDLRYIYRWFSQMVIPQNPEQKTMHCNPLHICGDRNNVRKIIRSQ